MSAAILYERAGRTATITLNRPQVKNALDQAALDALTQRIGEARDDDGAWILVIRARGADFWVTEAVYGASLERAQTAGFPGIDVLLREAESHPRLEAIGALAVQAGVRSVVLTRLRPPPPFASQYEGVVEDGGFRGRVHVPEDGDRLEP